MVIKMYDDDLSPDIMVAAIKENTMKLRYQNRGG